MVHSPMGISSKRLKKNIVMQNGGSYNIGVKMAAMETPIQGPPVTRSLLDRLSVPAYVRTLSHSACGPVPFGTFWTIGPSGSSVHAMDFSGFRNTVSGASALCLLLMIDCSHPLNEKHNSRKYSACGAISVTLSKLIQESSEKQI